MNDNILDDFDSQTVDLKDYKFRGSMSGYEWKYEQAIDRLKNIRWMIFALCALIFYPAIMATAAGTSIPEGYILERIIFCVFLIIGGVVYGKNKIIGILLALIPMVLILLTSITIGASISQIGFNTAIVFILLSGFYFDFRVKKIRKFLIEEIQKGNENIVKK